MDERNTIYDPGNILVEDDKIVAVGKDAGNGHRIDTRIDAHNMVVMPGIVDTHFHSSILHRGAIDDMLYLGMDKVLREFSYPLLRIISPQDVYDGASLAYLECIRNGITTVNDMYRHISTCADAAERIGIRACISSEAADLFPGQESLSDNENAFLAKNGRANKRIEIWFGGEWSPVCSPEFFQKARELATKHRTGIHVHLNESLGEIELCKKNYGKRSIEHVYDLGLLGSDVVAAHCVWLSDREIALLRATKTSVATCPVSNLKLGNGIARVHDLITARVNVGIGTDAYQNNLDMFEAIKFACCVQKGVRADASSLPDHRMALKMATVSGAKALGLDEVGSLEIGKKADLILVDLRHPKFHPILRGTYFNVPSNLVYAAHGDDVDTVMIDGKIVVEKKEVKSVDQEKVIAQATKTAGSLIERLAVTRK
jgi:5-methylthioadenosine/S-adenosylhomocysteine deaminase